MSTMAEQDRGGRLFVAALTVAVVAAAAFADATAAGGGRVKRQLPPIEQGNQVVDDIFQIPISTLNAVGSLIKSTRPLVRRTRERIQQLYFPSGQQQQRPYVVAPQQQQQQQYSSYGFRPFPSSTSSTQFTGVRPFYSAYFGGGSTTGNRIRQQRDDPLPQGRGPRPHRHGDDY